MNEQITGLASLGRFEDNKIAHVADGEMVIPPLAISLATKRQIFKDMLDAGINIAPIGANVLNKSLFTIFLPNFKLAFTAFFAKPV